MAVGLNLDVPVARVFGLRAGIKYGFGSEVIAGNDVGLASCGTNCQYVVYERTSVTPASAILLSADASFKPAPSDWGLQPYLLGGIGYRQHLYDRTALPVGKAAVETVHEAVRVLPHLGVGAMWSFRQLRLRLEADVFSDINVIRWLPTGGRYGDAFVTLGIEWKP
jgi:hypothetical protein